jgi:hypothetical protein
MAFVAKPMRTPVSRTKANLSYSVISVARSANAKKIRDVAEIKIVCLPNRLKCGAVPGKRERDPGEISQQMASRQQD